jgi:uncharacterized membrane protein
MAVGRGSIACGASILLFSVAPVMTHHLMRNLVPGWLVCGVAAIQIAAIAWMLSGRWAIRYRMPLTLVSFAAALMLLAGLPVRIAALAATGGCHAVAYTSLLIWFGMSLRPGREPLVTSFARRVRRSMPEKVVRYTRQVTIAWCVFFATQLAVSAALLLLAPASVWSAFVSLLNLPLLAAMVVGEFGIRMILFRHEPRTSLAGTMFAWRQGRAMPTGRP